MIVVDTSALIAALASSEPQESLIGRIRDDSDLHAPHLIDVEMIYALRRLAAAGHLNEDRALDVRSDFADLAIVRYPHQPLSDRMWLLRHNLTAYDAAFIALSEILEVPLITCDARLAAASGHRAKVELY